MKCIGIFLIFLILNANIIQIKSDIDSHSLKTDKIMKIIHTHKNYIFSEMRKVKSNFPDEYHDEVEKIVKNYETKMLSGDEKFEDFIMSKYSYLKYILKEKKKSNEYMFDYSNNHRNSNSDLKFDWNDLIDNYENHELLEKISDHLFKLKPYERKKIIASILKQFKNNEFYKNIAKKIFEKAYFYHKSHFNSLDKVLSFLVYSLSTGMGFETNKTNYKQNDENLKSNSLNNHYLFHNGDIPNSFKVNEKFKKFIDFLQQKYMKDVLDKDKTFNLKILNKLTYEEKITFNNYFNGFLKESIINNEEFKEIYTKNKMKDSDFLNLINKENSKNNIKEKFEKNVIIEQSIDKKIIDTNFKKNAKKNTYKINLNYQSFIALEERINKTKSNAFKSYQDYLQFNTKEGFFHRDREEKIKIVENQQISIQNKVNFVKEILSEDGGGISTSDLEDPKKANELIKTKLNFEKNEEKKKNDQEYKLMLAANKKIQDEKKAKIKEAIIEVAKTAKASAEMKVVQAKIDGSIASTKSSVGNLEKGLIPLLLKPIMIIFELLAKIPTKIIVAATKPLINLSIEKEKSKNKALREVEKKKKTLDLSGKTKNPSKVGTPSEDKDDEDGFNCDAADKKLKQAINDQLELLGKEEEEAKENLSEINPDLMNDLGSPAKSASLLANIIIEFIKKLIIMVIQHVPFFFFKICIPPGPLTFGCCPEAAFVPEQIYSIFSVFEKVERFKVVAKGYPTWLAKVKHPDFGEDDYYACAQSMLTLTESTLFNYCNMQTLVVIHPINLQGMYPGDLPLCFWACLQTMVICRVWINQLPTCDALINLQVLIKAMMFIPDRIKLGYMFNMCTYIPFLIRWDLVPKWKEEQKPAGHKDSDDELGPNDKNADDKIKGKKTAQPRIELNCADPDNNIDLNRKPNKKDNISPFAEALLNMSSDAENILNEVHNEVKQSEETNKNLNDENRKNLALKLLKDLRNPVNRTKIKKQQVNVVIVEWDPSKNINSNGSNSDQSLEIENLPKEDGAIASNVDYINSPDISDNKFNLFNPKVTDIIGSSSFGNEIIVKHIELYSSNKLDRKIESKFPFNALRIYVDANMTGKFYENLRSVTGLPEDINDRSLT